MHTSSDRAAVRVDRKLGITEKVEFVGWGSDRLFTCFHAPLETACLAAVIICSPILADFLSNYRREVLLSRLLAARGYAVQRFHYRGIGNSDGDPSDMTFERLAEDALFAADRARREGHCESVGFLGTRWGGLVAARAAQTFPEAPVALWEPTVEPARFFREAFRAQMMRNVKEGEGTPAAGRQLLEQLQSEGWVDVLGYPVCRALYDSSKQRTLLRELGNRPRAIQLVQFSRSNDLRGEYRDFVSSLTKRGFRSTVAVGAVAESWWFHSERILPVGDLVEQTAYWLQAEMSAKVAS